MLLLLGKFFTEVTACVHAFYLRIYFQYLQKKKNIYTWNKKKLHSSFAADSDDDRIVGT